MTNRPAPVRFLVIAAALLGCMVLAPQEAEARGPLYRTNYPSKITYKLWSGMGNVLFSWCEIPIEVNREIQNTDPFTGTFVGAGKGLWYTGRRFVLGAVDVVTFPVDLYGNNWQTIQRTEFPFIEEVES